MTDVLVRWVQMGWYPSCFVSNALARAGSPGGRTGGREFDKESDFFGRFRPLLPQKVRSFAGTNGLHTSFNCERIQIEAFELRLVNVRL